MDEFEILLGLFGGLGLFLYGMKLMGDGLENAAGDKLKGILEKLTSNRLMGVVVGAGVTSIIQSSSATTVMVVTFVNAGLMTLMQAAGVIMGANIGTTITAQMISFKLDAIAPIFIGIGAIMMMIVKKKKTKDIAAVILGFGILFMGMGVMSGAMEPVGQAPWFKDFILVVGQNAFLGLLAGLVMTAIVQSSSATTGILVALSIAGAIDMKVALPMILGCNIGTCVTALIASLGANTTGKKAALIHLLFNITGAVLFFPFINILINVVESINPDNVARQVANAHTIFNIITTLILLPFAAYMVKIVNRILPDSKKEINNDGAIYLDKKSLSTPVIAIEQVKKEIYRMANIAKENFTLAMDGLVNNDIDIVEKVYENEKIINILERDITAYLVEIAQSELPETEAKNFANTYHVINDIERIGDHVENIADLVKEQYNNKITFGDTAKSEIICIYDKTLDALNLSIKKTMEKEDIKLETIEEIETEIDNLEISLRNSNIERLNEKKCSPNSSVIFLDLISNLERIGDHANNIAKINVK